MNRIDLINIGWTCYNGYFFDILRIESYKPFNMDSSLFGIHFCKDFMFVDILFFTIKIFDKTNI